MEKKFFTVQNFLDLTHGRLVSGKTETVLGKISTDSRKIKKGEFFVALTGKNFNGHRFVAQVRQKGACGALISEPLQTSLPASFVLIRVADTLRALQDLAQGYRLYFAVPLIAITGSCGKTTTKEMASHILGQKKKVLKNEGNLNNQIGVPLTLFRLNASYEAAVLELAMSAKGEIRRLTEVSSPDVGAVTNVAAAHLQFLKTLDGVAQAKSELPQALEEGKTLVLNRDDPRVWEMRRYSKGELISFGLQKDCRVRGERLKPTRGGGISFQLVTGGGLTMVNLRQPGAHQVYNALAAASCAIALGATLADIKKGLETFKPVLSGRWERVKLQGVNFINDSYNANPFSMGAALAAFHQEKARGGRKIAVLGEMKELGKETKKLHREVGKKAVQASLFGLLTVGKMGKEIARAARREGLANTLCFQDPQEAGLALRELAKAKDVVFLKASRAVGLEKILETFKEH